MNDWRWMATQTIIFAITAALIWWYARETKGLRKEAQRQTKTLHEAEVFNALTRVHEQLQRIESYKSRRFLHDYFEEILVKCVAQTQGLRNYLTQNTIDIEKVSKELGQDEKTLREFHGWLKTADDALCRVEQILTDFDVIAIPYLVLGNEVSKIVARAYRTVLKDTAPKILPFVAIERRLRGLREPPYKDAYLRVLQELKIDPNGWTVKILKAT